MGKFFTATYEEYYNALFDKDELKASTNNLRDLVQEANNNIEIFMPLLDEGLEGKYSEELNTSLDAIKEELTASQDIINNELENVISSMESLVPLLDELKDLDVKYEAIEQEIKSIEASIEQYKDIPVLYDHYKGPLDDKINKKNQYEQRANELIEDINSKLNTIIEFNNTIVKISMAISSFESVGEDVSNLENMTVEEKEELIRNLINAFTEQYTVYKEAYEKYAKWNLESEEYVVFTTVLNCLGINNMFEMSAIISSSDNDDLVSLGFQTKELLNILISNNVEEAMENYFEKGQSWVESGMDEVYKNFQMTNNDLILSEDQERRQAELRESTFLQGLYSRKDQVGKYKDNPKEIYRLFSSAYDKLKYNNTLFEMNYNNSVETGMSIKGLKSRLKTVKYEEIFESEDFNNYQAKYSDGKSGYSEDYSILSEEERKRYEYLYEKYGAEKAAQYMSDIDEFVTYLKGIKRGQEMYEQLHDGNWDVLESFGVGYGDGFMNFINGFQNLASPQYTLTENDYARIALLQAMSENPLDWQNIMYDTGNIAGKATIPGAAFLAAYFTPGLRAAAPYIGIGLHSVSNMGNNMGQMTLDAQYDIDPTNDAITWGDAFMSCAPPALVEFVALSFSQAAMLPGMSANIKYMFSGVNVPAWFGTGAAGLSGILFKAGERGIIRNWDSIANW